MNERPNPIMEALSTGARMTAEELMKAGATLGNFLQVIDILTLNHEDKTYQMFDKEKKDK